MRKQSSPKGKIVVIGAGMAGLTAAAYLAQAGYQVTVYEQFSEIGGVTATESQDGYSWDLGPRLVEGLAPDEPAGRILKALHLADRVPLKEGERTYVFPDFDLRRPATYTGPYWRRERLKMLFPAEREGLSRYYRYYNHAIDLMILQRRSSHVRPPLRWLLNLQSSQARRHVNDKAKWSAEKLMDEFFVDPRVKAVYTAALSDLMVRPGRFPALNLPAVNVENSFDQQIPRRLSGAGRRPSYHFILGGSDSLVKAVAETVRAHNGLIYTQTEVKRIQVNGDQVTGVQLVGGHIEPADIVIASGGAREVFFQLIGRQYLPSGFAYQIDQLHLMESAFIVHLGVDIDPSPYLPNVLTHYYNTYDMDGSIRRCQQGEFHEGQDSFQIYAPSMHSPELAPAGHHTITLYTVAPNVLADGDWAQRRKALADRLIAQAENVIPKLSDHIRTRFVLTPQDFRERTHQDHHPLRGRAPVIGQEGPGHATPLHGLWFIGAQSRSGGGIQNVMIGAQNTALAIMRHRRGSGWSMPR